MMKPTVHLNGTSREALILAYGTALDALRAAYGALIITAPNGRDYPQNANALCMAQNEHVERIVKLKSVMHDLEDLITHVIG